MTKMPDLRRPRGVPKQLAGGQLDTAARASGIKLPFPQTAVMRLSLWRSSRCHLDLRVLEVFLRQLCAVLLVVLEVCLLTVS